MNIFPKLKCLFQFHQREWTTVGGSDCYQRRRCMVCGIIIEQWERHLWGYLGEWTTDDGSGCWQRRRCMVCGIIEQRYISTMFSDAVYVFGTTFSSAPSWRDSEELPDGTKVSQSTLAEQVILAAFAYLYNKKLIDILLEERKVLFRKIKTVKVKKLQATAPGTSGLEAVIFSSIRDNSGMYGITYALIPNRESIFSNPWRGVLQIVKDNLLQRGIVKQVVKGTTYKYVVNGDISKEAKQLTELIKTLKELQSIEELYQQMLSAIAKSLAASRWDTGPD
jgi:hypothetical protein